MWREDNFIASHNDAKKTASAIKPKPGARSDRKVTRFQQYDPFSHASNHLASEYQSDKICQLYRMYWERQGNTRKSSINLHDLADADLQRGISRNISDRTFKQKWIQGLEAITKPYEEFDSPREVPGYKEPPHCLEGCGNDRETGSVCFCGSEKKAHCLHPKTYLIGAKYMFYGTDHRAPDGGKHPHHHRRATLKDVAVSAKQEFVRQRPRDEIEKKYRMFRLNNDDSW